MVPRISIEEDCTVDLLSISLSNLAEIICFSLSRSLFKHPLPLFPGGTMMWFSRIVPKVLTRRKKTKDLSTIRYGQNFTKSSWKNTSSSTRFAFNFKSPVCVSRLDKASLFPTWKISQFKSENPQCSLAVSQVHCHLSFNLTQHLGYPLVALLFQLGWLPSQKCLFVGMDLLFNSLSVNALKMICNKSFVRRTVPDLWSFLSTFQTQILQPSINLL